MPRVWERGQRVLELRPVLDKVTIRRPWSFVVPENTKKNSWLDLIFFKDSVVGSKPSSAFLVGMPCRDAGRQAGGDGAPHQPSHRSAPPRRCGWRRKDARPSWSGGCARVDARGCVMLHACRCAHHGKEERGESVSSHGACYLQHRRETEKNSVYILNINNVFYSHSHHHLKVHEDILKFTK